MKYVRDIPFKEFVDSHHKAADEDLAELRRSNENEGVPLIFTETEEILGLLTGLTHPERILEIGTAHGYSSLFFAKKLPDARITTIERNPVMVEAARAEFASRSEGERIDFRVGDAQEILDELDKMPALYGVYQDGEGYMSCDHYQKLDEFMFEPVSRKLIKSIYQTVPDLREFLKKSGRTDVRPANRTQRRFLLMGGAACGFFLCAASAFQQVGIRYTTTAKAGFITALYVVIVPILSVFFGKGVKSRIWACVALAVLGLYLLCMRGELSLSFGDGVVLVCAFLFACQIMTVDYFAPQVDTVRLSQTQFLVTALLSTVCMFFFEDLSTDSLIKALPSIAYAGVMSSGVAYTLQIIGQQNLNPAIASITMSLESVFAALAGWIVLGQSMTVRELAGCVLMFAAIILAQL